MRRERNNKRETEGEEDGDKEQVNEKKRKKKLLVGASLCCVQCAVCSVQSVCVLCAVSVRLSLHVSSHEPVRSFFLASLLPSFPSFIRPHPFSAFILSSLPSFLSLLHKESYLWPSWIAQTLRPASRPGSRTTVPSSKHPLSPPLPLSLRRTSKTMPRTISSRTRTKPVHPLPGY